MNMRVLREEGLCEGTVLYTLKAEVLGMCRHVEVEVSPRNRASGQLYSVPEAS